MFSKFLQNILENPRNWVPARHLDPVSKHVSMKHTCEIKIPGDFNLDDINAMLESLENMAEMLAPEAYYNCFHYNKVEDDQGFEATYLVICTKEKAFVHGFVRSKKHEFFNIDDSTNRQLSIESRSIKHSRIRGSIKIKDIRASATTYCMDDNAPTRLGPPLSEFAKTAEELMAFTR